MNILGINGSPRIGGNTDILLDRVLEGARYVGARTEKVILSRLKFSPCQECEDLDGTICRIKDDLVDLYRKIDQIDALILASPIFFGSLTAQVKMMIDRFHCLWHAKQRRKIFNRPKIGCFISVCGSKRKDFFDNAKAIVKNLFATIGAGYREELFYSGIEKKGEILEHPDILEEAFTLGQRIASR